MISNIKIYAFVAMLMIAIVSVLFEKKEVSKLKKSNANLQEQNLELYKDSNTYRNLYAATHSQLEECKKKHEERDAQIKEYENKLQQSQMQLQKQNTITVTKYIEREKLITDNECQSAQTVVYKWLEQ